VLFGGFAGKAAVNLCRNTHHEPARVCAVRQRLRDRLTRCGQVGGLEAPILAARTSQRACYIHRTPCVEAVTCTPAIADDSPLLGLSRAHVMTGCNATRLSCHQLPETQKPDARLRRLRKASCTSMYVSVQSWL
jgi:hypothetical protein